MINNVDNKDIILFSLFRNYPEKVSAYTIEKYSRLFRINNVFNHLSDLERDGFITKEKGQMPLYEPTLEGKNYLCAKLEKRNWNLDFVPEDKRFFLQAVVDKLTSKDE